MNTTVNHKTLNAAARIVARVVSSRTTLPVLAQCHLQAGNGWLAISSTDLDQTITTMIQSETKDTGHCLVPAKRFASVVGSCKGNIELDYKDDKAGLHIINGATFRLLTMPVEEFPPQETLKEPQTFTVKANEFKRALKRVEYAMSTDESRYVLNGVCFELGKGTLRLIATDRWRITIQDLASSWPDEPPLVEVEKTYRKPVQILVPTKTINLLISVLPDKADLVQVRFTQDDAGRVEFIFRTGEIGIHLHTKQIAGNYPNYRQVIPSDSDIKHGVLVNRADLADALKRMEDATTEKCNSVKMTVDAHINHAKFTVKVPDQGDCTMQIPCAHAGDGTIGIAFNPTYGLEVLRAMDEENVLIHLIDELSPLVIEPAINGKANGKPADMKAVIMPMRMS